MIMRTAGPSANLPVQKAELRRTITRFALLGIAAYAVAMIATIPASVVVNNQPWRSGVAGTVWDGEVGVAGGSVVAWQWAPLRSLTSMGFAVDWTAKGPDTDLGGQALLGTGSVRLDNVSGAADASLLAAIAPNLPFRCDAVMQLDLPRVKLGGGGQMVQGMGTIDPGTCFATGANAAASPTPAMAFVADHIGTQSRIRLTPMGQRRRTLIDATLDEEGGYRLTLTQDGATLLPFTGFPAGTAIEGVT